MKSNIFAERIDKRVFVVALFCILGYVSPISGLAVPLYADEGPTAVDETPDYCADFASFSERFVRPEFPQQAPEDEQRALPVEHKVFDPLHLNAYRTVAAVRPRGELKPLGLHPAALLQ
ncbi:MAG: hypothetical protein II561_05645, partial [Thermoguttaceae bacterium]|nr:hypothetical protein [Thermoguttaceae bacterium]